MLTKARANSNVFNFPRTKIAASLHAPIQILPGSLLLYMNPEGHWL